MTPKALSREKTMLVQMYDKHIDREYYKVTPGFFGTYYAKIRTDRLEDEILLDVTRYKMPDKVYVNGELYKLTKENK